MTRNLPAALLRFALILLRYLSVELVFLLLFLVIMSSVLLHRSHIVERVF